MSNFHSDEAVNDMSRGDFNRARSLFLKNPYAFTTPEMQAAIFQSPKGESASKQTERLDFISYLVVHGYDINQVRGSETPLTHAAGSLFLTGVRFLLEKGANPNLKADSEAAFSPLQKVFFQNATADTHSLTACARTLIKAGARMEEGLLEYVVRSGYELPVVHFLVQNGASVDGLGRNNDTALLSAVRLDKKDIADYLLAAGANPNQLNNQNRNALGVALEMRHCVQDEAGMVYQSAQLVRENTPLIRQLLIFGALLDGKSDFDNQNDAVNDTLKLAQKIRDQKQFKPKELRKVLENIWSRSK